MIAIVVVTGVLTCSLPEPSVIFITKGAGIGTLADDTIDAAATKAAAAIAIILFIIV